MNAMYMPGFTAVASLYNGRVRYQSTTAATFYGGIVQPAGSELFDPHRRINSYYAGPLFDPNRQIPCIMQVCAFWSSDNPSHCEGWVWLVGSVNPVTGRCE